jgi:hypothetical protein
VRRARKELPTKGVKVLCWLGHLWRSLQLDHGYREAERATGGNGRLINPGVGVADPRLVDQVIGGHNDIVDSQGEVGPGLAAEAVAPLTVFGAGLVPYGVQGCSVSGFGLDAPGFAGELRRSYGCFGLSVPDEDGGGDADESNSGGRDGAYPLKVHERRSFRMAVVLFA